MKLKCTSFLGYIISQTKEAMPFWELLISKYKPTRIIELGTGNGVFSCYLKLICIQFNAGFYTFDIFDLQSNPIFKLVDLESSYESLNIFENENKIGDIIKSDGLTILFCDNGKKIDEFNIFAKYLKIGDIISAHDWTTEIKDEDVSSTIFINNLEHIKLDDNLEAKAYTKFFIRK